MSGVEDRDEGDEIKRKMAAEGPKIKKEFDRPGKLMVSGVPKNAEYTEEDLKREFSLFGPLLEVNIIRKKSTGIAKGFAFVTFKNPPDADEATKGLEGKDIGGDNPIHCERAVIGFIKQSQIASSRKRVEMVDRGFRGGRMDRGRGGGRGQPPMERGRGFRGMRGGPPLRGGRGRGGGYGGGGDMEGMYYNEEEEYYGGGGGEYWEGDPHGGEYPPRGRGRARGGPQRGMRGAPPGMRGRGGPPGARGGFTGRGGAGGPRGGYPGRGGPVPDRGGRPFRKTLLPNPPDMRGGRGGGIGRGYPPHPPANEEYYPEEEAAGYGEEYAAGGEEFYEEDPYNNGAGYAEEEQYGGGGMDEGYYGVPEAQPRHAPPARGRGGVGAAPPHRGGRNGPGAQQSYNNMGSEQPTRGGRPPASGPYSHGGGSIAGGGSGQMPMRGGGAQNRNAGPGRPMPSEPARRPPAQDPYNSYMEEEPVGPPRQRAGLPQNTGYEDYYGEEDMSSMHASQDPYASARPPAGRSQPPAAARGAPPRRAADPYTEEQYGMYEGGDANAGYAEDCGSSYSGAAPTRRGPAPSIQSRPSAGGRQTEGRGYVDISEYIGLGAGSASRFRDEYQGQGSGRDMDRMEREPRRPAPPSRREDPYMERRVAAETDVYESYPTSSRDPTVRKRPLDGYEASNAYIGYEEYRGAATPSKRERVERSGYDSYSSRQEGNYRRL